MAKMTKKERVLRKHRRVRKKIFGTTERPRFAVYKSLKHMHAQIIDDTKGETLVAASTVEKEIGEKVKDLTKTEAAKFLGQVLAERAKEKGVVKVVFDRGGFIYHGRIKAIAEGAREGGLEF